MFGEYGAYIIPAYAASAAVIFGLIIWPILVYRQRRADIDRLEKQGIKRRSGENSLGE